MNALTLSRDDPALLALEDAYARLDLFPQSLWKNWSKNIDIQKFRGEHAYIAQMWSMDEQRYLNSFDYLVSIGERDAMVTLGEDGAFGAVTFERDGVTFGRDLIDSVLELRFLRETLNINRDDRISLLDIGSGYGRFLHRSAEYFQRSRGYGVDGVPLSTFLCDFYLRYRGIYPQMQSVSLADLATIVQVDVATNQQSFSEMPLTAVDSWLKMCADRNIRYFFLEPHSGNLRDAHFVTSEPNGDHLDYYTSFERYGYRMIRRAYKFPPDMTPSLIYNTEYFLFERTS